MILEEDNSRELYDYVGGNVFYGVYYRTGKGFFLAWDMAFGKGLFDFTNFPHCDFDENLECLLERLEQHNKGCWRECEGLGITLNDPLLKFKFHWGKKKIYGNYINT